MARAAPPAERSALDVVLRCFIGEVGAISGMIVGRTAEAGTRALAVWGVGGAQPRGSWDADSHLGRAFAAPHARIEATRGSDSAPEPSAGEGAGEPRTDSSAVAAPITGPTGSLGAIYAEFAGSPPMPAEELCWTTDSYARLAALCMEGGQGLSATLIDSRRDRLTGCLNHDGLLDVLTNEIERAQRERHRLTCCFVDLDGFKEINDERGHLEGNRVLAATGEALRGGVRPYDAVGRFGGDEFVVVLPYAGRTEATQMIQRIRIRIGAQVSAAVGIPVFVSGGIAEWQRGTSALDLLDAADRALIDAKRTGGARVAAPRSTSYTRGGELIELGRGLIRGRRSRALRG